MRPLVGMSVRGPRGARASIAPLGSRVAGRTAAGGAPPAASIHMKQTASRIDIRRLPPLARLGAVYPAVVAPTGTDDTRAEGSTGSERDEWTLPREACG